MIKVSFIKDWGSDGTCYEQRIRVFGKDLINICEILQKEYEEVQRIKREKHIYTSTEMNRIAYQKALAETENLSMGTMTKYFLNLTQLESILEYVYSKDKRVKYVNTTLVLDTKGD